MESESSEFKLVNLNFEKQCDNIKGIHPDIQAEYKNIVRGQLQRYSVTKYDNDRDAWLCFYAEAGVHGMVIFLLIDRRASQVNWHCGQRIDADDMLRIIPGDKHCRVYHLVFENPDAGTYRLLAADKEAQNVLGSVTKLFYIFTSRLTIRSTDLLACLCKPVKYIILEEDCVAYAKGLIVKLLESSDEITKDKLDTIRGLGGPLSGPFESSNAAYHTTRNVEVTRKPAQSSLNNQILLLIGPLYILIFAALFKFMVS